MTELELAVVIDAAPDDIAREQIGGKLDAGKSSIDTFGEGFSDERFTDPWDIFQEDMLASEQGDEDLSDDLLFAQYDRADVVL